MEIPTPLARRLLNDQETHLRNQSLGLGDDPEMWQSSHLRRAFEIVSKRREIAKRCDVCELAKEIVLESVSAARAAIKQAWLRSLESSRQSALKDFNSNCRIISNCTKPTRLRKEVRGELDNAARSLFVENAINLKVVDLEGVQDFFNASKRIVERLSKDKNAQAIFKHLVTIKRDITHKSAFPFEGRIPKIALDYEALPAHARLACEQILQLVVAEKLEKLTAHDVFSSLYAATHSVTVTQNLLEEPTILEKYLTEIARIWTDRCLRVGRGNHPDNEDYTSPFQEFAERVLLSERDPGSRIYTPFTDGELKSAKGLYQKIPPTSRDDICATPFKGTRVITDHLLRSLQKNPTRSP